MRSVLAHGRAFGGLGNGPEGEHSAMGSDAGPNGEMGPMLGMSELGGAYACKVGVSCGVMALSLGCHAWHSGGLFVRGRCGGSRTDVPDGLLETGCEHRVT